MLKIYLDSCCLSRPYDDLSDDAVRLESEAVMTIIARCEQGSWNICGSDVLIDEIDRISDRVKKDKVLALYTSTTEQVDLCEHIIRRARELMALRVKPFDALHLASAEYVNADVFLSTDKRLVNAARRIALGVKVYNPAVWLMEVLYNEQ